jgi:NitT/TauT family transport system ATP-binding protein
VAAEIRVGLPRPRRIEDPELAQLAGEIGDRLRREVRLHGR